jgi:hypothetical protein
MAVTRANVEAILVRRLGALLTEAGLDGTTVSGSNLDLSDPIGWAVRKLGGSVANVVSVADADLAGIGADDYDQLFDLAEFRALESVSNHLVQVDLQVGPRSEKFSQLMAAVEGRLARKRKQLEVDYGFGLGTLEAGVVALDFMENLEDD